MRGCRQSQGKFTKRSVQLDLFIWKTTESHKQRLGSQIFTRKIGHDLSFTESIIFSLFWSLLFFLSEISALSIFNHFVSKLIDSFSSNLGQNRERGKLNEKKKRSIYHYISIRRFFGSCVLFTTFTWTIMHPVLYPPPPLQNFAQPLFPISLGYYSCSNRNPMQSFET